MNESFTTRARSFAPQFLQRAWKGHEAKSHAQGDTPSFWHFGQISSSLLMMPSNEAVEKVYSYPHRAVN